MPPNPGNVSHDSRQGESLRPFGCLMISPSVPFELRVLHADDGVVVSLIGCATLNEQTTPAVKDQLLQLAAKLGPVQLLLDLGAIRFLGSTGLGALLALHKQLKAAGGHLIITGVNEEVYEVFEATLLNRVLDVRKEA
jgi:anti-sigma B factor antagonist